MKITSLEEGMTEKTAEPAEKAAKSAEKKNGDAKKAKAEETPSSVTTVQAREDGKKTGEVSKTAPVETLRIETDGSGSYVEFAIEMTLNLGNMEFAKIHVGRRAPHKAGEAEADNAIKVVKAWTRREFRDEVTQVRAKQKAAAEKKKEDRKPKKSDD